MLVDPGHEMLVSSYANGPVSQRLLRALVSMLDMLVSGGSGWQTVHGQRTSCCS